MDFSLITRKVGPLPAWAWGAIVVGIAYGYYWWSNRNSEPVAPTTQGFYTDENETLLNAGYYTGDDLPIEPTLPPTQAPTPTTNAQWVRLVTDALVSEGNLSPTAIYSALMKVLTGLPITKQEEAIWNQAVTRFKQPPESYPPIELIPGSETPTTPTPPTTPPAEQPYLMGHVNKGWDIGQWVLDVRRSPGGNPNFSWELAEAWNPSISKNVTWHKAPNISRFKSNAVYRINWTGKGGYL